MMDVVEIGPEDVCPECGTSHADVTAQMEHALTTGLCANCNAPLKWSGSESEWFGECSKCSWQMGGGNLGWFPGR